MFDLQSPVTNASDKLLASRVGLQRKAGSRPRRVTTLWTLEPLPPRFHPTLDVCLGTNCARLEKHPKSLARYRICSRRLLRAFRSSEKATGRRKRLLTSDIHFTILAGAAGPQMVSAVISHSARISGARSDISENGVARSLAGFKRRRASAAESGSPENEFEEGPWALRRAPRRPALRPDREATQSARPTPSDRGACPDLP